MAREFFNYPRSIAREIEFLRTRPPEHWEKMGERMVVLLARKMAENVPAYKQFLLKHKVKIRPTHSLTDIKRLPVTDKGGYLKAYPYLSLFPGGSISGATTISSTSGSTGKPYYFPRGEEHDRQYAYTAEILLRTQFGVDKKSTLGLVCFGLGVWIGGIFSYKNFNAISQRGYPLTLLPIGPNFDTTLEAIKDLGHLFEQVVLMGYPPFVKDVLDRGESSGIKWEDYHLKILTAAEGFTEPFRKHIARTAKLENPLKDIANIYGTVELGTMGYETALSFLIRELAGSHPSLTKALFSRKGQMPSVVQYYPHLTFFEEVDGMLLGSGYASSIPLMRYSFPDHGGVISFRKMLTTFHQEGIDLLKEARKRGIEKSVLRLPFVYVYERPNNSITFRGANIYADQVRTVLDDDDLRSFITGRFSMEKVETKLLRQKWRVHVELRKGVSPSKKIRSNVQKKIVSALLKLNSEYADQHRSLSRPMIPDIRMYLFGDQKYFSRKGKQSWVVKKGQRA